MGPSETHGLHPVPVPTLLISPPAPRPLRPAHRHSHTGPRHSPPGPSLCHRGQDPRLLGRPRQLCSSLGRWGPPWPCPPCLPRGGAARAPRPRLRAGPGRQTRKNSPIWLSHRPLFWEAGPPLPAAPGHVEVSGPSRPVQLSELPGRRLSGDWAGRGAHAPRAARCPDPF